MAWYQEPHVVFQENQKGLKFRVSKKQALRVFDALIQRLREKGVPYNTALVPQAEFALPKTLQTGTRQHAIFLFVLCLWMRGGTESDTAMRFLAPLYDARPELFVPEYFLVDANTTSLVSEVATALINFKLGQRVDENSVGWVYNMRKIARHWGGDPRKLMNDKPTFDVLSRRIISKKPKKGNGPAGGSHLKLLDEEKPNGFMYFQEKMAGMIAYFLIDAELVPMFYAPVPVDIHVLRILVSNEVITVRGRKASESLGVDFYREEVRAGARMITEWYCRERKISPVALCDTLWLLSRSLCRRNPGNSGYVVDAKRKREDSLRRKAARPIFDHPELIGVAESADESTLASFLPPTQGVDSAMTVADSDSDAGELSGRKRYMGVRFNEQAIWSEASRVDRYTASCGRCSLQKTCVLNITSAAYYVAGKLLPERLRLKAPDDHGSFLSHEAFASAHHVKIDPRVRFAPIDFVEG